jgi:hypothetical protein
MARIHVEKFRILYAKLLILLDNMVKYSLLAFSKFVGRYVFDAKSWSEKS